MATQLLTATAAVPRVNLLPREVDERRRARAAKAGMAATVAASVGVVGLLYLTQVSSLSSAKSDLELARSEQTRLQGEVAKLSNVSEVYARVAAAEALLKEAMGQEVRWSRYLSALSLSIPDNVWLEEMSAKQTLGAAAAQPTASVFPAGVGTVTFTGKAFTHDDVAVWLESLAKQKGYANAFFSKSEVDEGSSREIVDFESSVTLTEQAYSGRYLKVAGSQP